MRHFHNIQGVSFFWKTCHSSSVNVWLCKCKINFMKLRAGLCRARDLLHNSLLFLLQKIGFYVHDII